MESTDPLLCDHQTGSCELPHPGTKAVSTALHIQQQKPVKVIYFTDPICSSCWGIEPQLRKLKLEYGDVLDIDYRMGGLLPDWNYSSGNINRPSDVAAHWDQASQYYDMPIDGDLWLEDPLDSSFPPSVAFKAAQIQDEQKAIKFLRAMRQMVFMQKKNITKWEHLAKAATISGLNIQQLKDDIGASANVLFEADLQLAKQLSVKGFPTLQFISKSGDTEVVYGSKPYKTYEDALLKVYVVNTKTEYEKDWKSLFTKYNSLTANEFSILSDTSRQQSEELLNQLSGQRLLEKFTTKNGAIWTLNETIASSQQSLDKVNY